MDQWTAQRVRETFLRFFKERGHAVIPSASLIPENDPSVLFTTAGMHPLVPYLMGQVHPAGKRLVNVQKCIRTGDIDEVGDNRHLTFFEMLGNWSLGDYFKKDAIAWSHELLTSKDWFGLDPNRLAVSVFAGDADASRDEESAAAWKALGINDARIAYLGKDDNWWPAGGKNPGPQGPDTEMFYWISDDPPPAAFDPKDDRWVEVWNDVFMQFKRTPEGAYAPLAQQNVDTGMGLERMLCVLTGKKTVFETDLFESMLEKIVLLCSDRDFKSTLVEFRRERSRRIIADHIRAATFMLGDPFGITPSNVDQGYVLRKLIRRAVRAGRSVGIITKSPWTPDIAEVIITHYREAYPELERHRSRILFELREEEERFNETLDRGLRRIAALGDHVSGTDAFDLYQSYGFPPELTEEILGERGATLDRDAFDVAMKAHQEKSRAATGQRFQGGLADHSDQSIRYHTATHLTHQALRTVLGDHVEQRGSNITPERMRFDFVHPEKLTSEQVQKVEALVRQQIAANLPVHYELMDVAEAKKAGVIGLFEDQYAKLGGKVKVYFIGSADQGFFSTEICGGPHVARTGLIGTFRIAKEEAVSRGVRRIRAVVEPPVAPMEVAGLKSHR
ncbi:MAG: alanine--tRNA ligase [bacterium]|nr:alanine--tRNA ligase [bacterium]